MFVKPAEAGLAAAAEHLAALLAAEAAAGEAMADAAAPVPPMPPLVAARDEDGEVEDPLPGLLADIAARTQARSAHITQSAARLRRALRERTANAAASIPASDPAALQRSIADDARRRATFTTFQGRVAALRDRLAALDRDLTATAAQAHVTGVAGAASEPAVSSQPQRAVVELVPAVEEAVAALAALRRSSVYSDCRWYGRLRNHAFMLVPHGIAWFVLPLLNIHDAEVWVIASAVITQGLPPLFTMIQRRRLGPLLADQRATVAAIGRALGRAAKNGRDLLDPLGQSDRRLEQVLAGDEAQRRSEEAAAAAARDEQARIKGREARLLDRITARGEAEAAAARVAAAQSASLSAARRRAAARAAADARDAAAAAHAAAVQARLESATAARDAAAQAVVERLEALASATAQPAWDAAPSATAHPELLALGTAEPAPGRPPLPVALAFPGQAALLIRTGAAQRPAGLAVLRTALLRALVAFPPGALRLTLIDPVGLGESLAPFLDLAHGREGAICGPVLSAADTIEQGLADLEAHCALIIQKRLGSRFATLADYNREAEGLREPLRLAVVCDAPAGLTERSLERLAALLRSGPRCGVHVWVLAEGGRNLPAALDPALFRAHGVSLRESNGRLALDHEPAREWPFTPATGPDAAVHNRLIARVVKEAVSAARVALPYTLLAPAPEQVWTRSAAASLDIPIGTGGAGRIQLLELGRGTCQHVLIGGRTGSGKSTLLHVLATSTALWYAPSEVQLCLIDFKKGVEFRAYAAAKLPHARVIAIESDREFGLSVLRDLDGELTRRGETYRTAGAQDVAGYRSATGKPMARILLVIDEFQEFFTEDDVIARDAALLLDRFVRQGRAFGLHVILGSQTLGGSYSIAKSSLGQMGIRIALPMNEADAHLLLDEDNDGSRLLNRPGDGIYNDQAGRAAGNSPFQVCWLDDAERHGRLAPLAQRAAAAGWAPERPPVVFAGDAAATRADLRDLAALAARAPQPADRVLRGWLGLASALSGAAEAELHAGAGGNLLVLGQSRDGAAAALGTFLHSLSLRFRSAALRLIGTDGEAGDGVFARLWPEGGELVAAREAGTCARDLAALADRRRGGDEPDRTPVVWVIWALPRIRALRADDGEPGGEALVRLLSEGPDQGIHVVTWCDALASFQRSLGRRALKEFDQRVLFQMSQSDSLELCDDAAASRLTIHTAIHAVASDGRRAKFRPAV